ncbi:peptidoglycan/LPS O-acetylase OafA/YrhL [Arcicella rosea]|uniref:acyltransferase family protein n=1 Tax=Arcicella rosea TaxID=502909 RepID=UPI00345CC51E
MIKNKPHFEILDGLRGVAALCVVIFHFTECVYPDYSKNFIGHGFLAVDFFFCLSGFVIAYAYDDRIKQMGTLAFFKTRLIRLHPLVVIGTLLGVIGFLWSPWSSVASNYTWVNIVLLAGGSMLIIPLPLMEDRYFNLFGFNAPAWSLFWEYVANILYAFFLHKISRRLLSILVILTAIALGIVSYRAGNLMGGWSKNNFWDGGVRLAYSFLAGLLVNRSKWIIQNKLGFIGLTLMILAALMIPVFANNWLIEFLIVAFYFPLLIALGAGTKLSSFTQKFCQFAGELSYPLYMTHYAFIWIFASYLAHFKPDINQITWVIVLGTCGLVLFAIVMMQFVDKPIRKYLRAKK